jgi:hypothetical protein
MVGVAVSAGGITGAVAVGRCVGVEPAGDVTVAGVSCVGSGVTTSPHAANSNVTAIRKRLPTTRFILDLKGTSFSIQIQTRFANDV